MSIELENKQGLIAGDGLLPVHLAKNAKENGFDAFTSSLFVSPYQKHELLKEIAEKCAEKYGIEFLYIDFREGFREGQKMARDLELYMQKYCGCIYSEAERYKKM